ncbi:hypothetical protein BD311DRAFT_811268 [Dichomitus squalens]|uniref:Uncharacterized protein n=1 Tax=Dichomitus squalens TaxID=114155 RepID=A0A4Q9M9A6_9APHY|nr:hypothetical protein BD311DRAFT_811268 [Dichomitus squalens]
MSATQQEQAQTQSFSFYATNEESVPDVPPRSSFPSFQLGNLFTPQDSISSLRQATGAQPGDIPLHSNGPPYGDGPPHGDGPPPKAVDRRRVADLRKAADPFREADLLKDLVDHHLWLLSAH